MLQKKMRIVWNLSTWEIDKFILCDIKLSLQWIFIQLLLSIYKTQYNEFTSQSHLTKMYVKSVEKTQHLQKLNFNVSTSRC